MGISLLAVQRSLRGPKTVPTKSDLFQFSFLRLDDCFHCRLWPEFMVKLFAIFFVEHIKAAIQSIGVAKILVDCPTRTYRYLYFHLLLCSMTKVKRIQKGNLLLKCWHWPASVVQKAANALIHWVCWFKTFCVNFRSSPPPLFQPSFQRQKCVSANIFALSMFKCSEKHQYVRRAHNIFS